MKTKENPIARCGIPLRDNEQTKENQLLAVVFQCKTTGSSEGDRALLLMRDPAEFQAEFWRLSNNSRLSSRSLKDGHGAEYHFKFSFPLVSPALSGTPRRVSFDPKGLDSSLDRSALRAPFNPDWTPRYFTLTVARIERISRCVLILDLLKAVDLIFMLSTLACLPEILLSRPLRLDCRRPVPEDLPLHKVMTMTLWI